MKIANNNILENIITYLIMKMLKMKMILYEKF